MMTTAYHHLFKVTIIGDSGVGKSNLMMRFADDTFNESFITTIGVDFRFRTMNVDDKIIKFEIWDTVTAGQEKFKTISTSYYRNSHAVIVVYDVSNRRSFNNIEQWLNDIEKFCATTVCTMIVGNKCDIDPSEREINYEAAKQYADDLKIAYIETSAKTARNVEYVFFAIAQQVMMAIPLRIGSENIVVIIGNKYMNFKIDWIASKKKWYKRTEKDVCLMMTVKEEDLDKQKLLKNEKTIDYVYEMILSISSTNNIVEWDIINYGQQKLFDQVIKYGDKLKQCKIMSSKTKSDSLIRDNRLYVVGIHKVNAFECEIDDELLQDFISNQYPYKLWNKFASNLKNNKNIECIYFHINNECMNNPLNIKKFVDILKCIEKMETKIKSFKLSFEGNIKLEYESHNDSVLKHLLYASIIKCIKSKSKYLTEIQLKYENKDSLFHFFDSKFCTNLLSDKYPNLVKLDLYLPRTLWNHANLISINNLINTTDALQEIYINTKLFGKHFDVKNNQKAVELLSKVNIRNISLSKFSTEYVQCCFSSLIQLICSNTEGMSLSFESIETEQLYLMINSWIDRLYELYKYYKQIKYCLECLDHDEKIKNLIFEYCQLQQYTLYIHVETRKEELNKIKMFLFNEHSMNRLKQMLLDEQLCNLDAANDIIDDNIEKITKLISTTGDVNAYIGSECTVVTMEEYEETKLEFLVNQQHSLLCCGYIRDISKINNIYMPLPIYDVVYSFYPKYDAFMLESTAWSGYENMEATKLKVSAVCDNTELWTADTGEPVFKSINNKWYVLDPDELTQFDIIARIEEEAFLTALSKKGININDNCYIDIISRGFICTNYGDVFVLDDEDIIFSADTFLLNNKNKHYMIDISVSASPHILCLTSAGNVFCFGHNDKGQCGVKNDDKLIQRVQDQDDDIIMVPFHLKKLSENFIKSIHCGDDFSFCLDKDDNLYCFGNNEYNKMALNRNQYKDDIIWEAVIHDFFNKKVNERIATKIQCGNEIVSFIDNKNQCFWSLQHEDDENKNENNIFHWQSSNNNKYKNVEIRDFALNPYCDGNDFEIILIDTLNKLRYYSNDDNESAICNINGLPQHDIIESCVFCDIGLLIFTRHKLWC